MINKTINNKLYFCSIGLLCALTYLLNFCTKIYQCALAFTIIAITINVITLLCGKSNALKGIVFAITISFTLLWKLPYYIDGKIVNGLVFASFSSVMISMYWSVFVFQKLGSRFSFVISNVLSLSVGAIIDGFLMGLFFVINKNFSYTKIIDIFTREVSYKMVYSLAISAVVLIALNILKNNKNLNYNLKMNNYL